MPRAAPRLACSCVAVQEGPEQIFVVFNVGLHYQWLLNMCEVVWLNKHEIEVHGMNGAGHVYIMKN